MNESVLISPSECEAMLAASRAAGLPLFVAYYRRALPRFLKVRELLLAGAIGEPRRVRTVLHRVLDPAWASAPELPWRVRPEVSGGGLFVDLGSHTLDLLDFLLGPLKAVDGQARSVSGAYPAEDQVRMRFACGGVAGDGEWDFCSDARRDLVEIEGDAGRLRFASFDEQPVVLENAAGRRRFDIAHPPHIQRPLVETVLAQLRGQGACPSTGESALRTSRVIDAVLRDYRNAASAAGRSGALG